jgi:MFS transporter, MHS family, proline/betaine transporter
MEEIMSVTTDPSTSPFLTGTTAAQHRKVTVAGSIGMFVEFYDYAAYGFFATTIAAVFFPPGAGAASLIMTWGIFGLTFFVRPLGGLIIGSFADRIGRRAALVLSLLMMAGATTAIGLIPSYETIGIAAPLLLLAMRLIQGFSAGGEVASALSFVGESAPPQRRGFMMSWTIGGTYAALLAGTSLGVLLNQLLSSDQLHAWGWRIPFLIAAPLGFVGFYIRRQLEDSPVFMEVRRNQVIEHSPLKATLADPTARGRVGLAIALVLLNSSGYYVLFSYMPSYLSRVLGYSQLSSLSVTAISLVTILIAIPVVGALSDRVGRKPILVGSAIAMAIVAVPCYLLLSVGNTVSALLGAMALAIVYAGHSGIIHCVLVELFPTKVRGTAYSLGYNVSTAIFGGAAPMVISVIISGTGNTSVPAYYVVLTAIGTALAGLKLRKNSGQPLEVV